MAEPWNGALRNSAATTRCHWTPWLGAMEHQTAPPVRLNTLYLKVGSAVSRQDPVERKYVLDADGPEIARTPLHQRLDGRRCDKHESEANSLVFLYFVVSWSLLASPLLKTGLCSGSKLLKESEKEMED